TDLNEEFINELLELFSNKLIFVLRRINFEKNRLNIKNRLVILSILKNAKVIVDLDIKANKKELDYLKIDKGKISTIISYHNYRYTPNDKTLMDVIETIKKYHSKIIKIATFCKNEKDALRLLQIQQALIKKKKTVIILGMGKFGTITRVFGTLWGNAMIFAPKTVNEATAKGQLTKTQLENIFNELNKFEIIN
ncbi:MAG TPA: type I 3-dehydroquinate dehydratase, partial [Patescibacteria group bacterium]